MVWLVRSREVTQWRTRTEKRTVGVLALVFFFPLFGKICWNWRRKGGGRRYGRVCLLSALQVMKQIQAGSPSRSMRRVRFATEEVRVAQEPMNVRNAMVRTLLSLFL